jgi:hypothetical protein
MKKINKRGEMTTALIVTLIVLIASFITILVFLFVLNPTETSDDSVCHNAVLTRSAGVLPKETIPLNCKTDYICLSKDGSCEKMTNPKIIKVKTKEEVYKSLAEEGANCWWMFGEGKADYIGDKFSSDLYCSICSQVAFDDSLSSLFAINPSLISRANLGIPQNASNFLIKREDFYEYLASTNISGKGITYLDYFLGLQTSKLISEALKSNSYDFGYIDIEKQHFIMMGEFSKVGFWQDLLIGMGKGLLLFLVLPIPLVGGPAGIGLVVSTVYNPFNKKAGYMIGTIMLGESGHTYLTPAIIEANSEDYNKLQCADIKTLA